MVLLVEDLSADWVCPVPPELPPEIEDDDEVKGKYAHLVFVAMLMINIIVITITAITNTFIRSFI